MAFNTESEVKSDMVRKIRTAGGYARRIEDQYGVGILDTVFIMDSLTVFCEVKMIRGNRFGPTARQWIEGTRILSARGTCVIPLLVGYDDGQYYIGRGWPSETEKRHCIGPFDQFLKAWRCFCGYEREQEDNSGVAPEQGS
jgi:hypothetical protein